MIFEAVECVVSEMNEVFRNKLQLNEDKVIISGIVNADGSIAIQGENKVLVTLINIEKEINGAGIGQSSNNGFSVNRTSPATINLLLMFSSYFAGSNYPEALRFTSFIIAYFQSQPVFNRENTPKLDPLIDKLVLEMVTMSSEQLNSIWGMIGAKYMPSVIYRLRMLTFDESIIREIRPSVTGIGQSSIPKSR